MCGDGLIPLSVGGVPRVHVIPGGNHRRVANRVVVGVECEVRDVLERAENIDARRATAPVNDDVAGVWSSWFRESTHRFLLIAVRCRSGREPLELDVLTGMSHADQFAGINLPKR